MKIINSMKTIFDSKSVNEAFGRAVVSTFIASLDPTIDEVGDIKTAVSEAVTNCIVHGYREYPGKVYITVNIYDNSKVVIRITDKGCGIEDIKQAMEPLFTTDAASERAGLGFAVMESFMDKIKVYSKPGKGTTVVMEKKIRSKYAAEDEK